MSRSTGLWARTAALALAAVCLFRLAGTSHAQQAASGATPTVQPKYQTATIAAGCFWSMEAIFKQLKGVQKVLPGYAGGKLKDPSYEDVCTGNTGHAESINITFDPSVITFKDLLEVMMTVRDPTTLNRQGNDEGNEYRSVIFYRDEQQRKDAIEMIQKINASHIWADKVVTKVEPFRNFYRAEDYHLDYYAKHPNQGYCRVVIAPEIAEFREKFHQKLKSQH